MNTASLRIGLVAAAMALLCSAYYKINSPALLSDTAKSFLASLTPEQRAKATFQFGADERMNWHFVPIARKGLPLKEMKPEQRHLAMAMLNAGMSQKGYIKATTVMSLEEVLRVIELTKPSGNVRDPELYFVSIFGEPSETGTWGMRWEGHHLSVNFTMSNGKIAASPNFYGANPAKVLDGPRKGLRVLSAEEDLGRAFYTSLDAGQKKTALMSTDALKEIVTTDSRKAVIEGKPAGIALSALNAKQKEMLDRLIAEYTDNFPEQVAMARQAVVKKAGGSIHFAWAGGEAPGEGHYYRITAPTFIIEYDNTQNNNNHIHSVWRDLTNDWGTDILAEHYRTSPHAGVKAD